MSTIADILYQIFKIRRLSDIFILIVYRHRALMAIVIISQSPVNHHLYADDTQLYISFSSPKFEVNMLLLHDVISKVSNWMSCNLLLNFFFLVFLSNCLNCPILSVQCLQTSLSVLLLLLAILGSSLTPHCY